jgi:Curlin associated repeat
MLAAPLSPDALAPGVPPSPAGATGNGSEVTQSGSNNFAAVSQTGAANLSAVIQHGTANTALVTQRGGLH